jgi:hypothetical protein
MWLDLHDYYNEKQDLIIFKKLLDVENRQPEESKIRDNT